jgi:hypothetical protein
MKLVHDLLGKRFGRLIVVRWERCGRWACECDCGALKVVFGSNLRKGRTLSCGCLRLENARRFDNKFRTHGMTKTPTYRSWRAMLQRCSRVNHRDWPRYGGRGIKVCERWLHSFEAFLEDMGPRPQDRTLDRIDVNGNYEPGNCRWASGQVQAANTRCADTIPAFGQTRHLAEWSEIYGVHRSTIRERICRGWPPEEAVSVPPLRKGKEFLHANAPRLPRRERYPGVEVRSRVKEAEEKEVEVA